MTPRSHPEVRESAWIALVQHIHLVAPWILKGHFGATHSCPDKRFRTIQLAAIGKLGWRSTPCAADSVTTLVDNVSVTDTHDIGSEWLYGTWQAYSVERDDHEGVVADRQRAVDDVPERHARKESNRESNKAIYSLSSPEGG